MAQVRRSYAWMLFCYLVQVATGTDGAANVGEAEAKAASVKITFSCFCMVLLYSVPHVDPRLFVCASLVILSSLIELKTQDGKISMALVLTSSNLSDWLSLSSFRFNLLYTSVCCSKERPRRCFARSIVIL